MPRTHTPRHTHALRAHNQTQNKKLTASHALHSVRARAQPINWRTLGAALAARCA